MCDLGLARKASSFPDPSDKGSSVSATDQMQLFSVMFHDLRILSSLDGDIFGCILQNPLSNIILNICFFLLLFTIGELFNIRKYGMQLI